MMFMDWELGKIYDALMSDMGRGDSICKVMIAEKIDELRKTSINKRYTLRTTDWLSEAAKKQSGKKRGRRQCCKRGLL